MSIVTGTRRMKQMLQLTTDNLKDYTKDPEDWQADIAPVERVNEVRSQQEELPLHFQVVGDEFVYFN